MRVALPDGGENKSQGPASRGLSIAERAIRPAHRCRTNEKFPKHTRDSLASVGDRTHVHCSTYYICWDHICGRRMESLKGPSPIDQTITRYFQMLP
jgi:hypothetical protein